VFKSTEVSEVAENLYRLVGERIRRLRDDAGLTQEDLAKKVGLKRTSITNVERGRQRLPLHQMVMIADQLGAELRDLVPARAELAEGAKVPVRVGDIEKVVPPITARYINRLLEKTR
jgi:transcriptional regulator with XRE-family HTH domain